MTLPRLEDFHAEKIDMLCRRCDRHGVYDRKALVKKFGAATEFGGSLPSAAIDVARMDARRASLACSPSTS